MAGGKPDTMTMAEAWARRALADPALPGSVRKRASAMIVKAGAMRIMQCGPCGLRSPAAVTVISPWNPNK